ncbi:DUF411 domain-containing protein (plasmid) [Paracoccus liaowanqingii]|uniref:DUF411 domain-containing protein n=1 Tax=Paracoccus liaowanqingii TaxID=2560053 RepID=A0A4Y5SW50_9RHOB|nr:DUF411 domain-containing protein [Paracoccus liaowanqingii]
MNRRLFIGTMAAVLAPAGAVLSASPAPEKTLISVARSPDCSCCGAWIDHLRESGFTVEETFSDDVDALKDQYAVPQPLRSCHTALVEGYVIEGHVPAEAIRTLLDQNPDALGLAVPGMPIGSPGMEMGDQSEPFEVILWTGTGTNVFARY